MSSTGNGNGTSPIDWGKWGGYLAGCAHPPGRYAACEGAIDEGESFIDERFTAAKGGGEAVGFTKRSKGVKILAIVDRHGLALSVSTHAVTLESNLEFYLL